jgi:hypothetical protein
MMISALLTPVFSDHRQIQIPVSDWSFPLLHNVHSART